LLGGKTVNLKLAESDDVDFAVNCHNDGGFWANDIPIEEQMSKSEWMKSLVSPTESQRAIALKMFVIQKKNGTRIGLIYHRTNQPYGTTEIGYFLLPSERAKGYGTEAVQLMVDYLFLSKDIVRIEATTNVANKASQKVLEKAGFIKEGTIRKLAFVRGVWTDHYLHSILREEWREPKILTKTT
jgi:RimJ/RimL family protein N-acetyltransferase